MATKILKGIDNIAFCNLTASDVVRHPLVQKIVNAYDEYEKSQQDKEKAKRRNYNKKK